MDVGEAITELSTILENMAVADLVLGVICGLLAGIILPWLVTIIRYLFGQVIIFRKETNLTGVYDCEYHIPWKPESENIIYERIFIFKVGKKYYGYLINNNEDSKYRRLKRPGLRLQGELFVLRYFIGWWSHPLPDDNTHGAFNIRIDLNGKDHEGQWNGESNTYGCILEGRWVWKKNISVRYGVIKLIFNRIFGNS